MGTHYEDDVVIQGNLTVQGTFNPLLARSRLEQDTLQPYPIFPTDWKVWDTMADLPAAGAADDLAIVAGGYGTDPPSIQTGDLQSAGATSRYARAMVQLPPEYVAGQTVVLRFSAGMVTTVADNSCTLDVECYESDREVGVVGSDLCTTSAVSINSLTFNNTLDFTITPTGLAAGDQLDVRITIATNDAGSGTAVIGCIGSSMLMCDVKG
jgi:hypothetical protein